MKQKNLLFAFAFLFVVVTTMQMASAAFTTEHLYWTAHEFNSIDSAITQQCAGKLEIILDGNTGADVPVLHYYDNDFMSYVFTHTRNGYQECLQYAGTDTDLLCNCYGGGTHIVQDNFFHNNNGVVPTHLEASATPNLIGHMIIEQSFEVEFLKFLDETNDPMYENGQLDYYNSIVLDTYLNDKKYIDQLNHVTGLDTRNDINIFSNGYKGEGFFDTVYDQKVTLPWWFYALSWGMTIFGLGMSLAIMLFARRKGYAFWLMLPFLIIGLLGILILVAFYTHNAWQVVTFMLKVPSTLGLLDVDRTTVEQINTLELAATRAFFQTGVLPYDDASGLTYTDRLGVEHSGALHEASKRFTNVVLPIMAVILVLWIMIFGYMAFFTEKKKKRK